MRWFDALRANLPDINLDRRKRGAPDGRYGRTLVGIVTIIEEEFEAAQKVFGLDSNIPGTAYFVADDAHSRQWDVALIQASDRSNIPAYGDVTDFMEDLRPQVLILLGVAGGLCQDDNLGRDGIQPGDVIFADQVNYVEFLKIDNGNTRVRSFAVDHPSEPLRKNVCRPISKTFKIRAQFNDAFQPPIAEAPCKIHVGAGPLWVRGLTKVEDTERQDRLNKVFVERLARPPEHRHHIGIRRDGCSQQ